MFTQLLLSICWFLAFNQLVLDSLWVVPTPGFSKVMTFASFQSSVFLDFSSNQLLLWFFP
jgi:hypothetical protein